MTAIIKATGVPPNQQDLLMEDARGSGEGGRQDVVCSVWLELCRVQHIVLYHAGCSIHLSIRHDMLSMSLMKTNCCTKVMSYLCL